MLLFWRSKQYMMVIFGHLKHRLASIQLILAYLMQIIAYSITEQHCDFELSMFILELKCQHSTRTLDYSDMHVQIKGKSLF